MERLRWWFMRWCVEAAGRHIRAGRGEQAGRWMFWGFYVTDYADVSMILPASGPAKLERAV